MAKLPFDNDDLQIPIAGMLMVSEADFVEALAKAERADSSSKWARWAPLEDAAVAAGAKIAGRANHPGTHGVLGRLTRDEAAGGVLFSGRLFAVLPEPAFDDSGRIVFAERFRVAAVELSGVASWLGEDVRLSGSLGAVQEGRCCGPATICAPPVGGGEDPPVLMPTNLVGVAAGPSELTTRRASNPLDPGVVSFGVYRRPDWRVGPGDTTGGVPSRVPVPDSTVLVETLCVDVVDPGCEYARPICGPEDIGFTTVDSGDAADVPVGSANCLDDLARPVRGLNVPEACTYAYFGGDTVDPSCRGSYGGPPLRHWVRANPAGSDELPEPLMCRFARWVPGSGSVCETTSAAWKAMHNQTLALELGGVLPGEEKTHCDPYNVQGVQHCVTCTNDGTETRCVESLAKPPLNPALVDTSDGNRAHMENGTLVWDLGPSATDSWANDPEAPDVATPDTAATQSTQPASPATPATPAQPTPQTAPASNPPQATQPAQPTPPGPKPKPEPRPPDGPNPAPRSNHPTHAEKNNDHGAEKKQFVQTKPRQTTADPVDVGDGSLVLEDTDLSFPGPSRPLVFSRIYRSASRGRSAMGSNWRHIWDVRLQVYDEQTIPPWLSPWCGGFVGMPTAVAVHWGDSSSELFLLDIESRLYLPQAGSIGTLANVVDGWALRFPDGRILRFDAHGCLVLDVDRFGNAFTIEWEQTPLGLLLDHYCSTDALVMRNETLAARRNALLAWLTGVGRRPSDWRLQASDFPLPSGPADLVTRLAYARDYLLYLASFAWPSESIDGGARYRVRRVSDAVGRSLVFSYRDAAGYVVQGSAAFGQSIGVGLLARVEGPAGASVEFDYNRPADYPVELHEAFLVHVKRSDAPARYSGVVAAPTRETRYAYQWPTGKEESYAVHAKSLQQQYNAYYATFVGCRFDGVYVCGQTAYRVGEWAPGDPRLLARLARNAYISDVADNIVTVRFNGSVLLESRYPADPGDDAFDRVVAQRYGADEARQDPRRVAADLKTDHWLTGKPKATIAYCDAGPLRATDRTDKFLPEKIRDRYPLERAPTLSEALIAPTASRAGGCNYGKMAKLERALPGWRERLPYFDAPDPPAGQPVRLLRTPLAAEQLAGAQLWDPTHNDLVTGQEPNAANPTQPLLRRIVGRRAETAKNSNRICGWSRSTDRDGNVVYVGLNYRGQALVEAFEQAPEGYLFVERLYNADGSIVEERRPTNRDLPWQSGEGRTRFFYDEFDPTANRGWNGWLPVFWSRRANLIRVLIEPEGDVCDVSESGSHTSAIGRFVDYSYEPLFNQVATVVRGSIAHGALLNGVELPAAVTVQERITTIFDYQELSADDASSNSIGPLLEALRPWGFPWLRDDPAAFAYQFPLTLYDQDLNGDGMRGSRFASMQARRGVGLPVLTTLTAANVTALRQWTYRWAPHGLAALVRGPDGESVRYDYYPTSDTSPEIAFGDGTPSLTTASFGGRGFLACISRRIAGHDVKLPAGAPLAAPALAGPYAYVSIEQATSAATLLHELQALGLPAEQIEDLLATLDPESEAATTTSSYCYAVSGAPRIVFDTTGATYITSDTDGRVVHHIDARGTSTTTDYDERGRSIHEEVRGANGDLLAETTVDYDDNDDMVHQATALTAGATATSAVWRYRYTPEGLLAETTDPEMLVARHDYDRLKRPSRTRLAPGTPQERRFDYTHDEVGRLTRIKQQGSIAGGPRLEVLLTYDGFDRLLKTVDPRGYAWQFAYDDRDLLTFQRRSDTPFGQTPPIPPSLELGYRYNDFGELLERFHNLHLVERLERTEGGRVVAVSSQATGTIYCIADLLGRPAWSLSPDGTETVTTYREQPHRTISSEIVRDGSGTPHTTATLAQLDPLDTPTSATRISGAIRLSTTIGLDGLGRPHTITMPDRESRRIGRNLAGWVTRLEALADAAADRYETIVIGYDRRGATRTIRDDSGQVAEYTYTQFGEPSKERIYGVPPIETGRDYDALGRVIRTRDGATIIEHRYDNRHDPVEDVVAGATLARRVFDDLGRPVQLTQSNPGLDWLTEGLRTVTTRLAYDDLSRVRVDEITHRGRSIRTTHGWTPTNTGWRSHVRIDAGTWQDTSLRCYDLAGRLERYGPPVAANEQTVFRWLGSVYAGRSQHQPGWQSRFEEKIVPDAFLEPSSTRYSAVDVNPNGAPQSANDAQRYAPSGWNPHLHSRPLLEIQIVRDTNGRHLLEHWHHTHPTGLPTGIATLGRLRGFTYSERGRLASCSEDDSVSGLSSPPPPSYQPLTPQLAALIAPANRWIYHRDAATDELLRIDEAGGAERFDATGPRSPAHQLTSVTINGALRALQHDGGGRIIRDGADTYHWHPDGRLAAIKRGGQLLEAYAYDALGRLIALYITAQPSSPPDLRLAYDLADPVGAERQDTTLAWRARWGPLFNQLVALEDGATLLIPLLDPRCSPLAYWQPVDATVSQLLSYTPEGRLAVYDTTGAITCDEASGGGVCDVGSFFGFGGALRGPMSGLLLMGARWYHPELGEFLAADPRRFVDATNLYLYAAGDPINYSDPTGLERQGPGNGKRKRTRSPNLPPKRIKKRPKDVAAAANGDLAASLPGSLSPAPQPGNRDLDDPIGIDDLARNLAQLLSHAGAVVWSLPPFERGRILHRIVQNTPFNNPGFDIRMRNRVRELKSIGAETRDVIKAVRSGARQIEGVGGGIAPSTVSRDVAVILPPGTGRDRIQRIRGALQGTRAGARGVTVGPVRTGLPGAGQFAKVLAPVATLTSALEFDKDTERGDWQGAISSGTGFVAAGLETAALAGSLIGAGVTSLPPVAAVVGSFSLGWAMGTPTGRWIDRTYQPGSGWLGDMYYRAFQK